jgi:peptide deformylase
MIATMREAKGVGLAAPQVGINQRLFVMDAGEGPMAIINPKITKKIGAEVLEEGCLSIPEVTIQIKRPQQITVKYMDEDGQAMEMTCEDLMARVIQHETDHLDGKLIIDYADINEKAQFKEQLMALKEGQKKRA